MPSNTPIASATPENRLVTTEQVKDVVAKACPVEAYRGKRILLIVPDGTRTAPVGLLFQTLFKQIAHVTRQLDVISALGTHQPMSEAQFCERLEITETERKGTYGKVQFFNHEWDNPKALRQIGTITADEISQLTGGLFAMDVQIGRAHV